MVGDPRARARMRVALVSGAVMVGSMLASGAVPVAAQDDAACDPTAGGKTYGYISPGPDTWYQRDVDGFVFAAEADGNEVVVLNTEPPDSSVDRSLSASTRFPLWAAASAPPRNRTRIGCAFMSRLWPVVEYRTWPSATCPGRRSSTASSNTVFTSPMARCWKAVSPSQVTIPALSCPRCWRA